MLVLLIWQLLVWLFKIPSYLLPSPTDVFCSLPKHFFLLMHHASISTAEMFCGLFFAIIFGFLSAALMMINRRFAVFVKPFFMCLQSLPHFILTPLFLVWFGHHFWTKIVIIALSCYFCMTSCFYDGLTQTPEKFLEQASLMKACPWRIFIYIRLMNALPSFFSGLRLTAMYAPISVLAVDWIGASSGLGYLIMLSHSQLEMNLLFLSLITIMLLSLTFYRFVTHIEKYFVFWQDVR